MKNIFLSLLFFCGVCISAFGQELQSPQINQNAIFANPGLAGSKGQTRINNSFSYINDTYHDAYSSNYVFKYITMNALVSGDGLVCKDRIGFGAYIKNETRVYKNQYSFVDTSGQMQNKKQFEFNYHNVYAGFMVAPKFYIGAKDLKKIGRTISPSIGLGFKITQLNYSGNDTLRNSTGQTKSFYNGLQTTYSNWDFISLGLLYSSPKSYIGLKVNFKQYQNTFFLSDISVVLARSYFNKNVSKPNFSFNPQFYLAFPIHQLTGSQYYHRISYLDRQNEQLLSSFFCLNLDFRYKKFLFGSFIDATNNNGVFLGLTAGLQLESMKLTMNYSYSGSKVNGSVNGLFLSANFYLRTKKERYR